MEKSGEVHDSNRTPWYAYYTFSLLFLLYLFDYTDRLVVSSLFPFIKEDWNLSDTQCGLLVSVVYWSITLFTIPVSIMVDRWSRKKSIGIMAILWSIATAACAFTRNFKQLFVARAAIGVGEAGYAPGGTAMISALFPPARRALFLGIWTAAIPLGSALGIALGGVIAKNWGWESAFGVVAIPGFIVAILFLFTRDYRSVALVKTARETGAKIKLRTRDIVKDLSRTGSASFTYAAFACNTFVTTAMLTWLPSYFERTQEGLGKADAGLKASVIMLFAVIGAPLGGYLADRWQRTNPNARLHFAAISSLATGVLFFCAVSLGPGISQYIVFILGGVTVAAFVPAAAAVTQDVVHPGLRATSYALCVIVQNLLGSSMGPIFVGAVSDAHNLTTALMVAPIFNLLGGLLFLAASVFYQRDLAKVEKVELQFD